MRPPDIALRDLVRQWVEKANADLDAAEQLASEPRLRGIVAFHCQKAGEKYLKAYLVRWQVEFPKTHDLRKLLDLAASIDPELARDERRAEQLTPFGAEIRYPSDAPELLQGAELELLTIARGIRDAIEASLRAYLAEEGHPPIDNPKT